MDGLIVSKYTLAIVYSVHCNNDARPRVHHEPEQVYISDVEVSGHTKLENKFVSF